MLKQVLSEHACTGVFYFRKGKNFVQAAERLIQRDERVNGEFYVCPTYNVLVEDGMKVKNFSIPKEAMYGLGTPEDLEYFLSSPLCREDAC